MKTLSRYLLTAIFLLFAFTGCSKQPAQEIGSAKSAVDAAFSEGAEKYAPEDARRINDELASAMTEVKVQDGKFFKDYSKAKQMLAAVKSDADSVKAGLAAKKEAARKIAISVMASATSAVEELNGLLQKAKKEKGKINAEALTSDIKSFEESLSEVQKLIDAEDYNSAASKSNLVKDKASGLSAQISEALKKPAPKKAAGKPTKKTSKKK